MDNIIDDDLFNEILENVVLLTGVDEESLPVIKLYINKFCQEVTIMTNRSKFPEDLKYLAITSTTDMYSQYIADKKDSNNESIQSMSEEGRTVNFGTPTSLQTKLQLILQQQLDNNLKLINRYRLLYKVRCPEDVES